MCTYSTTIKHSSAQYNAQYIINNVYRSNIDCIMKAAL